MMKRQEFGLDFVLLTSLVVCGFLEGFSLAKVHRVLVQTRMFAERAVLRGVVAWFVLETQASAMEF